MMLEKILAKIKPFLDENERLRAIFPKILTALGTGSRCACDASIEFLERIPEEVAKVAQKRQWKPIQTAPKDGTITLLLFEEDGNFFPVTAAWDEEFGEWSSLDYGSAPNNPTHWMPIPDPPRDE